VTSCQKRDQAQINDPVLAHNHPADRTKQPLVDLPDLYLTFDPTTVYGYPSGIRRYNATLIDAASVAQLAYPATGVQCIGQVAIFRGTDYDSIE
jgi:hypothetical protein